MCFSHRRRLLPTHELPELFQFRLGRRTPTRAAALAEGYLGGGLDPFRAIAAVAAGQLQVLFRNQGGKLGILHLVRLDGKSRIGASLSELPYQHRFREREALSPQQTGVDLLVAAQPGQPAQLIDQQNGMVGLALQGDRRLQLEIHRHHQERVR